MLCFHQYHRGNPSLPSRERGLKLMLDTIPVSFVPVAPFAGAWIEIFQILCIRSAVKVAPFAGAWIEMIWRQSSLSMSMSLPSRERGLKSYPRLHARKLPSVAPFAGAWIEIGSNCLLASRFWCRSLRGSVD